MPSGLRVGNSLYLDATVTTSAPIASRRFTCKIISSHYTWRKGNDCLNVFGCDQSGPGIDFSCGFRLQRRQLNGNPDVSS
jgi:hypothetical protein